MLCPKCNAENLDTEVFCANCGANLAEQEEVVNEVVQEDYAQAETVVKQPNQKKKFILLGAIAAGVVAIAVVLFFIFGGNSPESVIKQAEKAFVKGDFNILAETQPSQLKKMIKAVAEEDDIAEEFKDSCKARKNIKFEIKDKDELDEDEIDDLEDDINETVEYYAECIDEDKPKKIKISKAYEIECEISYKYDGEKEEYDNTFVVYKSGGKWYLYIGHVW